MHHKLRLAAVAASVALSGCAGNMKVQPMTTDPEGYSAIRFPMLHCLWPPRR
ncbi:hypothetical protein L539_3677 [Bordetella hinzii 5132]|nr:hypothetical protein L539_3677 [Bordetella hinzii 5132]